MDFGPHLLLAILEGAVGAAVLALTALGLSLVFGVMRVWSGFGMELQRSSATSLVVNFYGHWGPDSGPF